MCTVIDIRLTHLKMYQRCLSVLRCPVEVKALRRADPPSRGISYQISK
jgi:hypothetical protein